MKDKFHHVFIFLLGVLGIIFFIFANPFTKLAAETEFLSKNITNNDIIAFNKNYDSLINEMRNRLHEKNYGFVLDYAVSYDENIEIIIKLPIKKIKQTTRKELNLLITEVIKRNNFDPKDFHINITSYYEFTKEKDSIRLSYNDLMGYLLQSMEEKNYDAFSLSYEILPETIKVTVNLPIDKTDEITKEEVQQIAFNIIKQNNYNPNLFQINITNHIIVE